MTVRTTLPLGLAAALMLGACGSREGLQPAAGETMPVAPATAARAPTADELLDLPAEAEPGRTDETITRSEERDDDRFDLPPTG